MKGILQTSDSHKCVIRSMPVHNIESSLFPTLLSLSASVSSLCQIWNQLLPWSEAVPEVPSGLDKAVDCSRSTSRGFQ